MAASPNQSGTIANYIAADPVKLSVVVISSRFDASRNASVGVKLLIACVVTRRETLRPVGRYKTSTASGVNAFTVARITCGDSRRCSLSDNIPVRRQPPATPYHAVGHASLPFALIRQISVKTDNTWYFIRCLLQDPLRGIARQFIRRLQRDC